MIHKKVLFKGEQFWLHNSETGVITKNLSPIHHYDDDGDLLIDAFEGISFAVVTGDGSIVRFCEVIGHESELVEVD